ncbi:unnamed protein product [Lactuca virosa]|uniref:Retrotransposon gag domain-containing protein n=1 Tax=Lactuca virosa TaxID=75947 RepID=A0AAU9PHA5_9ASTR|nr:unnamed protein product [Lactuca virosa]
MIRVAIGGKSKALLSHLTSDPPSQDKESYEQWEQEDLIVFSWLIQNIEPTIAGNLTEYPTAKMLWDALVVTYSSGRDKLQTFNLHVKANDIKQNDSTLEEFWITLQGVWGEIDRIDPNPMKCPDDIKTYARIRSEQKLFQFLNALDQKYESIKREILLLEPLPSAEAAYATVQQCFRLVGYPEWWADGHKKSTKGLGPKKGRAPTTDKNIDRKTATGFGGVAATRIDEEVEGFSMETGTGGKKEDILKTPINQLYSN